jgi:hypothetical protein
MMMQIIQAISALVAIIFTPISCWLAYKNIPEEKLSEARREFAKFKVTAGFLVPLIAMAVLFLIEALSSEPLTRISVAKMCLFSWFSVMWVSYNLFLVCIKTMINQTEIMKDHVEITKKTAEHVYRNSR